MNDSLVLLSFELLKSEEELFVDDLNYLLGVYISLSRYDLIILNFLTLVGFGFFREGICETVLVS
jgi:hypothetical protein